MSPGFDFTELSSEGEQTKERASHEEIAQIIGTSRETVTRLLAEFKRKKFATLKGSTLLIHNKLELEKLVGS
jgi:CRP/FNR family transcriptional regulator, cyclic AMP receptor protein